MQEQDLHFMRIALEEADKLLSALEGKMEG